MNNKLVNIIIPIYNGELYLERCLESVLKQSYTNIEVILVNDGSTDHSLDICNQYRSRDSRIKIIDKSNSGVSDSRNCGIKASTGEYLVFLDCDDYIEEKYVENLYFLISDDCDFGITGWVKEDQTFNLKQSCPFFHERITVEKCLEILLTLKGVQGYPFSKIFRNRIIKEYNLSFNSKISILEDLLFCINYVLKCNTIQLNTEFQDYHYVLHSKSSRADSILGLNFNPTWLTEIDALEEIFCLVKDYINAKNIVKARLALSSVFYINRIYECGSIDKASIKRLHSIVKKYLIWPMICKEGDLKWDMQVILSAISPKFEYYIRALKK